MKVMFFSVRPYDRKSIDPVNQGRHDIHYTDARLTEESAAMAHGFPAVCVFVNDTLDSTVIAALAAGGTRLILLRCTGFNNVDLTAAAAHKMVVMRVLHYSPYSVAEHVIALIQTLNRKTHKAYLRIREENFLLDGLLGMDLHGKTVGIAGTGKIGAALARIMHGFGCTLLGYDNHPNEACTALGLRYVSFDELLEQSDIVSLHMPLTPDTHYIINERSLALMKPTAYLINTSRGPLIDSVALIRALKAQRLGAVGLDVYEEEGDLFFQDLSEQMIGDDVFMRLLSFPNVLITGHQAFFTHEALRDIAQATMSNIDAFESGQYNTPSRITAELAKAQ